MKWGAIIPLVGGASIGCSEALGTKPNFILSYPAFAKNDGHLTNYWPDVPYHVLNAETNSFDEGNKAPCFKKVDMVVGVPPCAGLSMLNCGGSNDSKKGRGGDAVQNQWMYLASHYVLDKVKPQVFFAENAPGLFTNIGKDVLLNLKKIAEQYNYSMSVVKTNCNLHGIPQNRTRTFFFMWKSKTAPILSWYNRDMPDLTTFLNNISSDLPYQDYDRAAAWLLKDPSYRYMKDVYGDDWRWIFKEGKNKSILQWMMKTPGELDKLEAFAKAHGNEKDQKLTAHILNKLSMDKGFWDWSAHVYFDEVNAVISKNYSTTGHPVEDRLLTLRENMALMGLPHDFMLTDEKLWYHITQNVPTPTTRDMTFEIAKFLGGELKDSGGNFVRQDKVLKKVSTEKFINREEFSSFFTQ